MVGVMRAAPLQASEDTGIGELRGRRWGARQFLYQW
jgi:hypothetical protein